MMDVALSIGNFDGVHRGHVAIVQGARATVGHGKVVIWSFNPNPAVFLHPDIEVERLTSFTHRRALLLEAGADEVVELKPSEALLSQSPKRLSNLLSTHSRRNLLWKVMDSVLEKIELGH